MRLLITSAFIALTLCANSFAQNRDKKDPCADAQSQAEMNMCWGKEYKAADARLNEAYRQFMAKLNDEEKASSRKRNSHGSPTVTRIAILSPTNTKAARCGR